MTKKEEFKSFVKNNPILVNYIKNEEMTWQKFYEIYDLYGEDAEAWKNYITPKEIIETKKTSPDIMDFIKGINLDTVKEGINSLQRVLSVIGDLAIKDDTPKEEYKPRPLYKQFED